MIKKMIKPYRGLPKGVYIIFLATVLNNLGNFVAPVLTLLMKEKMGIDVALVGLIVAMNGLVGLFGSLVGGKLIDLIGRKSFFVGFKVSAALVLVWCVFIDSSLFIVLALMFVNFTSSVASPVFNTIMTDITTEKDRKAAFSLRYLGINVGYAVGPVIATQLYRMDWMTLLFLGDALTVLLSVLLIVFFVEESKPDLKGDADVAYGSSTWSVIKTLPVLFFFSLINILLFVVFSQFSFGMPLTVTEVLGESGSVHYGVMLSINAIVCSLFTVPLTVVTKDISPSKSIQYGGLLYAVGFGSYAWITSPILFYSATIIWTLGEILIATNTSVFIANHSPKSHRGRFNAIFPIIRRIGSFLGPVLVGLLIKVTNYSVLWIVIGTIACLATISMGGLRKAFPEIKLEK